MLKNTRILVSLLTLVGGAVSLSACGQQGPLYLPEPPAAKLATLPETLPTRKPNNTAPADSMSSATHTPIADPGATPK
jgi:predicted small lipoprotein YifL